MVPDDPLKYLDDMRGERDGTVVSSFSFAGFFMHRGNDLIFVDLRDVSRA